jgi:hypothetical protein
LVMEVLREVAGNQKEQAYRHGVWLSSRFTSGACSATRNSDGGGGRERAHCACGVKSKLTDKARQRHFF